MLPLRSWTGGPTYAGPPSLKLVWLRCKRLDPLVEVYVNGTSNGCQVAKCSFVPHSAHQAPARRRLAWRSSTTHAKAATARSASRRLATERPAVPTRSTGSGSGCST